MKHRKALPVHKELRDLVRMNAEECSLMVNRSLDRYVESVRRVERTSGLVNSSLELLSHRIRRAAPLRGPTEGR